MKIIDLLNKIANGEEVPEKIRFEGKIFEKQDKTSFYCIGFGIFEQAFVLEDLNKEVEIIEEDKKIEKIDIMSDEATPNSYYILNEHGTKCYLTKHSKVIADRVNLLIDKVNNMENKQ